MTMFTKNARSCLVGAFAGLAVIALTYTASRADTYGFGVTPTAAEVAAVDIDVRPDGKGLPAGRGTAAKGKTIYAAQCAACHGDKMQGVKAAGGAALVGGRGSLTTKKQKKTIESYWPYATTIFDYVRRAMPMNAPGSLTADEIYSVTAYILSQAKIVKADHVIDASSLPKVMMPNRNGFIPDPRPDLQNYR